MKPASRTNAAAHAATARTGGRARRTGFSALKPWWLALGVAVLLSLGVAAPPLHAAATETTPEQIESAASAVRADPALGGTTKQRTWRFKSFFDDDEKARKPAEKPSPWMLGLASWLAEGGRGLVWLVGAVLVAVLLVSARRWVSFKGLAERDAAAARPSHVRDLDIRPESLPDDIGGEARHLWLAGSHRAALSLLYRGTLSRLVHGHAVPIKSASTEGDCVRLAERTLPADASGFVRRLVGAWQFAVYGGHLPASTEVLALCDEFERRLGTSPDASGAALTPLATSGA